MTLHQHYVPEAARTTSAAKCPRCGRGWGKYMPDVCTPCAVEMGWDIRNERWGYIDTEGVFRHPLGDWTYDGRGWVES